jgi:hypothetical protein
MQLAGIGMLFAWQDDWNLPGALALYRFCCYHLQ